jgi:formate dehydrogenase major subunit
MKTLDPEYRSKNFEQVILGFSDNQAVKEASRCLECGCHEYENCKLIKCANLYDIDPERLSGEKHPSFTEKKLVSIERDQGKCILCNLCVRECKENAGKGILGLVDRGFKTVIKPEFDNPETVAVCKDCRLCVEMCPTGALRFIAS